MANDDTMLNGIDPIWNVFTMSVTRLPSYFTSMLLSFSELNVYSPDLEKAYKAGKLLSFSELNVYSPSMVLLPLFSAMK